MSKDCRYKLFFLMIFLVFFILIYLSFVSAENCWVYTTYSTCPANTCKWKNDTWNVNGGWCEELNCWSLYSQSECTITNVPGKNCTWQGGGVSYGCEKISCWSLSGTNVNSCVNNSQGLSCSWSDSCYPVGGMGPTTNCYQYYNQSSCANATGCAWGNCIEIGCWNYNSIATCNSAKDPWNGKNCTWDNTYCTYKGCWNYNTNESYCVSNPAGLSCEWKWNSCQDKDCYSWDYTNTTACVNNTLNLSCTWSGSYCMKQDCWSYSTNATCSQKPGCTWKSYMSSGYCNEVNCWTWDSMNGGTNSSCVQNSSIYGLNCIWSGNPVGNLTNGWCYKNIASVSCSNKTSERECMDTFYCWWQYHNFNNASQGGTCNEPGSFGGGIGGSNTSILNEWNPGCYIFDMNSSDCNNVIGCNYTGGNCIVLNNSYGGNITLDGINCSYINSSTLCNNIPALSSCCAWQNGSCVANKLSAICRDQTPPPATSCENANMKADSEKKTTCEQMAGSPWYMPCQWSNSTSKCEFKASDVFGNGSQSIMKISNQKACEAAGGKWITEYYCEGNISLPTGRCEYKFDDEDNCNKACFGCEKKDSKGNAVNLSNARTACEESTLGFCEFYNNTNAPNGIGYCKAKEQFRKGVVGDCNLNCGDCTYKGKPNNNDTTKRPRYFCENSNANSAGGGCKWITDNSTANGGYCLEKGEKTCEDSCDRCKTQSDCSNIGRTSVSNQSGSCKWQGGTTSSTGTCVANIGQDVEICWDGIDNTDDNPPLIDCADPSCFADSFCGFVSGDCSGWTNNQSCIDYNCEWATDNWGSWCDIKGSQCWKYNQNNSACNGIITITNQILNISTARLAGNNINTSKTFSLTATAGLVEGSITIINASGTSLAGNFTVNYTTSTITFSNNTFMVSGGGSENLTNISYQYYSSYTQKNCQWSNGTGSAFCEKDWSKQEVCMGLGQNACMALNASGCNWTIDSWCSGTGNGSSWCASGGGWCDNINFKPKDCWKYSASASCGNASGCGWRTDQYSMPHCEVNWSANCWLYTNVTSCNASLNCIWDTPLQGGGWCMNKADKCWSYTQETCNSALEGRCYWQSWSSGGTGGGVSGSCQSMCWNGSYDTALTCDSSKGCAWKAESGWCEETEMASCSDSTNMNNQTSCQNTTGCRWKSSGWCDPKGGGFSAATVASGGGMGGGMGGDCYKYDGNRTLCENKTIINISCGWTINNNPSCEVDWSRDCWRYISVEGGCNATNGCWFKNDTWSSYCTNIVDQCWSNTSYQSWNNSAWQGNCSANPYCINSSWGCEPKCMSQTSGNCNTTFCRYNAGWCNPKGMNDMFAGMEAGAPTPLGHDDCGEAGKQASVDICGFGMKDMGDSYGIGAGVSNFENSSVCNKEKLSSFVMGGAGGTGGGGGGGMPVGGGGGGVTTTFGTERTGNGNDTIEFIVYFDTDGLTTGGCYPEHNDSAVGYEFKFRYSSAWNANTSKAIETFNAYQCENNAWSAADIKLSAWKKKMCSEMGGPMIAFKKTELTRFPTLYDSTKDMRVYAITIGNTGNISNPTDYAGPGWATPGSIDFEIKNAFDLNAGAAQFEDILRKGFVKGEDCFNSIDDDNDNSIDCADYDCQYSSKCSAYDYSNDTRTPQVTGIKIEEYYDAALIMYDTNKPTNGSVEIYGYGDTQCLNKTNLIYDIGILSTNVRDYKTWHTALVYDANNTNISLNWPMNAGSTYNYKIKVCDSNNKCAVSKCSSFRLPSLTENCAYCNFVTRIQVPTGWKVAYDVDRNGTYEHIQGEICGPYSGLKTNYTIGRKVNVKIYASDSSTYIEFLNASLTITGLNNKVRMISGSGDMIHSTSGGYVGLPVETRDKIVNNLHPEVCRIKIPVLSGGTCDRLYHCDDSGENCVDRTTAAGGAPINAAECIWNVPYCEFSTYKTSAASGGTTPPPSSGGGGGGATTNKTKTNVTANATEIMPTTTPEIGEETPKGEEKGVGEKIREISGKLNFLWIISITIVIVIVVVIVLARYKGKTGKNNGIVMISSSFINMLKEKIQGKDYKGKWINLNK